jgi:RHS repeat-associated protein
MRRIVFVCAAVAAAFVVLVAVGFAKSGQSAPSHSRLVAAKAHRAPGSFAKSLKSRSRRSAAKRVKRLASAKATRLRLVSHGAFAGQDGDAALGTLESAFPQVLAPVANPIPSTERVVKYGDDGHSAVVAPADATPGSQEARKRLLVMSTLPLRLKDRSGQVAPMSTEITEPTPGELAPKNALTDVTVNRDLHKGIEFAKADVAVRLTGANLDQPATVRDGRAFWANVQTDTDFVTDLLPDGVETFDVLRSQQSPERLSFEVDVPDGGSLALDDPSQVVEIKDRDGKVVAMVGPSMATDADGQRVPATWTVQGTLLQIQVDHLKGDFRYPILVDPEITVDQDSWMDDASIDFAGWAFTESNPNALVHLAGNSGLGRGLNISLPGNLTPPANLWGMWEFRAPGDTYVSAFGMTHFSWYPLGGRSCAVAGVLGSDNPISWNAGQLVYQPYGSQQVLTSTSPWGACPNTSPGGIYNWTQVHVPDSPTRGNAAAFQWWAPNAQNGAYIDSIILGGAQVQITDDRAPVNFTQFGLPAGWSSNSTLSFSSYATDNGLGMSEMDVSIDGGVVGSQSLGCDADFRSANRCPPTQRVDVTQPALSEGIHYIGISATDAVGNESEDDDVFTSRVDTIAPYGFLSGPGYDLRGQTVGEASYTVHVRGDDSGPDGTSGVAREQLLVNGQPQPGEPAGEATHACDDDCLDGDPKPLEADLKLNADALTPGTYTLSVRLTDQAGNVRVTPTWTLTVASGTVTSPTVGQRLSRRATLVSTTRRSGISNVRWEYRTAATSSAPAGAWTTIPVTALRDASGSQPSSSTISFSGTDSPPISWEIPATPGLGSTSVALDVRGVYNGSTATTTNASRLNFDTKGLDDRTARATIGPGQVNLLTGNLAVPATDVAIAGGLADLRVGRTYNSRDADSTGPLGPGWKLTAPVLDDVDTVQKLVQHPELGYAELELGDGTVVAFNIGADGSLTPAVGYERWAATIRPDPGGPAGTSGWLEYVLTDAIDGSSTVLRTDSATGTTYYPEVIQEGPPATAITEEYENVGGKQRIKALYGPPSQSCPTTFGASCRALLFVYATSTTATGSLPANWGDVNGQLTRIDLKTVDPATGSPVITAVASYTYDNTGRLRASWDPRISPALKTQYVYDANGLMTSLTPPGEAQWNMSYTQISGETERGRLAQVSRTVPAGPASWTVAYNLPMSGTNAPTTMTPSAVGGWGQADLPTDAAAVFPPDQVPSLPTSDYTRASVHYLNRDGYEVNDLEPGGGLNTSERDRYGNIVRELTARNRATALAAGSPVARSHELDTQRVYQDKGLNLTDEIGPLHSVRLDSGSVVAARQHTVTRYDETKPSGDSTDYHLPTTVTVSAQIPGQSDADARTTTTGYDWTLREATSIVKGAQSGGPALAETMQYDSTTGLMTSHRQPRSPNADAATTTKFSYYGMVSCNSHPEWYMMPCQRSPGAQPGGSQPSLPTATYQYNKFDQVVSEDRGGRVKSTAYDGAGRPTQIAWSGIGTAVPTSTITYDASTGREATRSAVVNGATRTIEHHYDTAGELSTYVDGTGRSTTTTHDLLGRPLVIDDGKGTQTNTYDTVTGRLKTIVDSQAGTIAATYDADGNVATETLPNGLRATYQTDETGQRVDLTWVKTTGCSTACTWLHFGMTRSIFGQQRTLDSTMSQQTELYDGAGRLAEVHDTPVGKGCTVRKYGFDEDSDRWSMRTYSPGTGGACDTSSTPVQVNHTYDTADRIVDIGYSYDAQGRITAVPAADAGGDPLTSSFFADDLTRSQTQAGTTNSYDLDPARRAMVRATTAGGVATTETSHYSDDSDKSSWTATDTGHWSRNVTGVDGDLVATVDDASDSVLQLTDLHGNVAATAATSSTRPADTQVLQPTRSGSTWTMTPVRPLAPGAYVARARQNDASGNVGTATSHFIVSAAGSPEHAYRDIVNGDGPEAYWRLGESTGTTAGDETAGHNGTYAGGPQLGQPGALGGEDDTSVWFDGVNDGVKAFDQPWRSGLGFTVETWVKTTQDGGTLMSQGSASDSASWKVRIENTAGSHLGQIQGVYNAGQQTYSGYSSLQVDDGQWHHVVVSFARSASIRVSVDGVAQSTAAGTVATAPAYAFGFDEGSGATAYNTGSVRADAAIGSLTRTASGRFGGALNFTGSTALGVSDNPALRATTALTVEAWVKPTANPPAGGIWSIASKSGTGLNSMAYRLGVSMGSTLNPYAAMGSQASSATSTALPLNTWSHVAMTWDKATTTMKLYTNGQLIQTLTSVPMPVDNAGALLVGQGFIGSIDELKVYQRALTQTEVNADQNLPASTATAGNPSAAFGLDDNLGNVLTDHSGNGRNVTLTGTAGWATGQYGSGIAFNGTNYGSFTDPGLETSTTGMTLSAWIKTPYGSFSQVPFFGGTTFGLYGNVTGIGPAVCFNTGTSCLVAPFATTGVWTHLTATYDKTTVKLYVNGALAGSQAASPTTTKLPGGVVGIGRDTVHSQAAFAAGTVDELRAYPRPLSAAEVTRDYNQSVAQNPGGPDGSLSLGNGGTTNYFAGQLDEPATYPRVLSDTEIAEHSRTGSRSPTATPTITAPADGAALSDATPVISGTGPASGMAANTRIDVFNASDLTTPVQSLLAPGNSSWSGESVKGLPAGSYTAKVTQNDQAGRYNTATRSFSITTPTDPETGYATSVRSDNPRAYWRLGETSGTTAADDHTGHPATYTGSPTLGATGALSNDNDKAPGFDGVDDHADAPNTAGFFDPATGDFSIEAWIKTTTNNNQVIAGKGTNWQLTVTNDAGHTGQAKFTYDNSTITAYSNARADDGAWHHIVALADRDTATTVYLDGTPGTAGPFDSTALTDTNPLRIGAGPTTGYFTGQIDEVAFYNTALSAARIGVHRRLGALLDAAAPSPAITAPADSTTTTDRTPAFTGTAGSAATDAGSLSLSIAPDPTAGPLAVFDYDEFGVPRGPSSASRYGYLGGKQRSTELPSGAIAMGARSYIPTLGRFLQVDPVEGGSANPYDYALQDPVNVFDLDGQTVGSCLRPGPACEKYKRKRDKLPPNSSPLTKACRAATIASGVFGIFGALTKEGTVVVVTKAGKLINLGGAVNAITCFS